MITNIISDVHYFVFTVYTCRTHVSYIFALIFQISGSFSRILSHTLLQATCQVVIQSAKAAISQCYAGPDVISGTLYSYTVATVPYCRIAIINLAGH